MHRSISHQLSMIYLLIVGLILTACSLTSASAQTPREATPTPTATMPPPPPQLAYTEIESDEPLPFIVQRLPAPGETLAPDGNIELLFDRPMDKATTAAAFTLQLAADPPQPVAGQISWPSEGVLRFTPNEPLERDAVYDVIMTQEATDTDQLPLVEPFTFRFNTPGYLQVSQVIPNEGASDIETDATITVMFNRPIVPLTSLAEAENFPQPLTFEPPLEGSGEWLNTSIYVFKPAADMPGGTTFTARVAAGLQDAAEQTILPNDFEWQFTTQPPEVVWNSPNNAEEGVGIETAIQVTFNQPIDLQSAEAHFEMSSLFLGSTITGNTVEGELTVDGPTLTFTPTERLEFDTSYQVTIEAGVTSTAGGQGSRTAYRFDFTTVPLPEIVGTRPSNGDQTASPYTNFSIQFNAPINPKTVMAHVSMTPPLPITPTEIYTDYSSWNNSFHIYFGAKPSTDYEVRIRPGIEDPYGNQTQDDLTVRFRTDRLRPAYRLLTPGFVGLYDADLPAKLVVGFTNIQTLEVSLYQLTEESMTQPEYRWYDLVPQPDQLVRQWTERVESPLNKPAYHPIDLVEDGGALAPGLYLLDTTSPQIEENYNRRQRHLLVVSETALTLKAGVRDALVWATDLAQGEPQAGLTVEFYNEGSQLGTATTDQDGIARLELPANVNRNNILAMIRPSADGTGFSAVAENWQRGISPYEFGLDLAYNLPDYAIHLYTDRPIYRPGQMVYFKGVLRQEDDVDFILPDLSQAHITVRDVNYETIFDDQLTVNPNGTFNGQVELQEGASLGQYVITVDFANQYFEHGFEVAAYRPPEFEVTVEPAATELLRRDDLQATINANYFFGGPLANAEVSWNLVAESYQFKPRQLGSYSFYDTDDPYVCFDCWWWQPDRVPETLLSGEATTDATGQLSLDLDGAEIEEQLERGSYRLTLEATVTGSDNQFISGRESIILHKGDYYVGLSPQEYVADAGEETAIDLIAVDWQSNRLADKLLNVQIIRYEWVNTFVENETGGGYWRYETKKNLIDQFNVTTDAQGEAVARFTPPQGGSYQIVVQDAATLSAPTEEHPQTIGQISPIRSSIFVWVAGQDAVSWRRENHDRITLISDKAEYAPGETAEILIPSPFEGEHQALVTIERGRIMQHELVPMNGSSEVYALPITTEFAPNIYVSVVLIRGREAATGDSPAVADYKVGILPLDVRLTQQKLNITLSPNEEQAEPATEVTYRVEVTDDQNQPVLTELSLDLVDKAVLSLQPRPSEAIVESFYHRRPLAINTASNLAISVNRYLQEIAEDLELDKDEFFGEEAMEEEAAVGQARNGVPELMATEADGAMMAEDTMAFSAAAPAEPAPLPAGIAIREEFSDTAYWNPVVTTDQLGRAEISLTLPDNLTTWVMRGVGLSAETQVGEATVELVATKPLLVRPVTPRFFVVDDRAELAANISNNTDSDLSTEVTLSAEGVSFSADTPAQQTVTVPARGETKVTWNVVVEDVPQVDLTFAAVSGDYQDAAKPRLSTGPEGSLMVYRYTAPDIVGTAGQLTDAGSRTEIIALPRLRDAEGLRVQSFDDQRGELTVQIDPSLAAGMQEGLSYLQHYEYECTEQTVSRFLPNLLTFNALQKLGIEKPELAARLPGLVEEGLDKLYNQQKPDGGWGWWQDGNSNVHVTAYVVFALTKAQQANVTIKADVLSNGQNFLLDYLQKYPQLNTMPEANRQAFILYALAEDGQAPDSELAALFDTREKLAHYGRAYLALALDLTNGQANQSQIDTLLSDINNAAIMSATGAHWEEDNYDWWAMNTDTRSTAIILDALARLDPTNDLIPNVVRWLMVARQDGIWETTQETAWALIALTDWMVETGELEADYEYTVSLNQTPQAEAEVTQATVQDSQTLSINISDLVVDANNRLTIARTDGNGRLYYSAHLKVYLPVEELDPVDRGIIVSRRYTLESCEYVDSRQECPEVREAQLGEVIRVDLTIVAPNDLYYVVVEDPLPAGAEAIDTGLATTSLLAMDPTLTRTSRVTSSGVDDVYLPYYYRWWRWYSRSELRDEKVVLFADYLPKGTYEYSYFIRTTLPGDYQVIPTLATEFYFPEVFGRSDGRVLSIGR